MVHYVPLSFILLNVLWCTVWLHWYLQIAKHSRVQKICCKRDDPAASPMLSTPRRCAASDAHPTTNVACGNRNTFGVIWYFGNHLTNKLKYSSMTLYTIQTMDACSNTNSQESPTSRFWQSSQVRFPVSTWVVFGQLRSDGHCLGSIRGCCRMLWRCFLSLTLGQ